MTLIQVMRRFLATQTAIYAVQISSRCIKILVSSIFKKNVMASGAFNKTERGSDLTKVKAMNMEEKISTGSMKMEEKILIEYVKMEEKFINESVKMGEKVPTENILSQRFSSGNISRMIGNLINFIQFLVMNKPIFNRSKKRKIDEISCE